MTAPAAPDRLARVLERIDEINATDPRREPVDGEPQPRELIYGRRMSDTLAWFLPDAPETLQVAVRAQHVARWQIPRTDFPEGRAGYKKWRARLMRHHAEVTGELLREEGYDEESIDRIATLLQKRGLKRDPDVQALEDVACLVFLRWYFEDFAAEHPDEKLVDILRKTWRKMSERGREAALDLELGPEGRRLLERALEG